MDYVVVQAATKAAYEAKRAILNASAQTSGLPPYEELTNGLACDYSHQAARAIEGNTEDIRRVGWEHPDRVFWLVARLVARAMSHEVLDDGDPEPKK